MNLYKYTYSTPKTGFHIVHVIANYENEACHILLRLRLSDEKGILTHKKTTPLYDI